MRDLVPEEMEKVEKRIRKYVGSNYDSFYGPMTKIVLNNQQVFYLTGEILKHAQKIPRENIICMGTCLGRFTKNGNFRLKISSLHVLFTYCMNKVKVKQSAEMNVLYGNHVQRAHLQGLPGDIKKNEGVVLCTVHGVPLGFGVMSKGGTEVSTGDRMAVVVVRHADSGEYLREEKALM